VSQPRVSSEPSAPAGATTEAGRAYWRRNLRYVGALLLLWALVSFGCGIVWADALDRARIPGTGFPVGFWFAQQGAIYTFLLLIAAYVVLMNRLDRAYGVLEE
jgi:putative solute:sodium symporter small subunit